MLRPMHSANIIPTKIGKLMTIWDVLLQSLPSREIIASCLILAQRRSREVSLGSFPNLQISLHPVVMCFPVVAFAVWGVASVRSGIPNNFLQAYDSFIHRPWLFGSYEPPRCLNYP